MRQGVCCVLYVAPHLILWSSQIDLWAHTIRIWVGNIYRKTNKPITTGPPRKMEFLLIYALEENLINMLYIVVSLVQPFLVPSSPGSEEQLSKLVHPPFWHHTICLSFWQGLICVTFSWTMDKTASSILDTKANFAFCCFCFFAAFLQSVTRSCLEIMVEIMETSDIARFRNQIFHLKSLSKNQPSYTIAWCQNSWPKREKSDSFQHCNVWQHTCCEWNQIVQAFLCHLLYKFNLEFFWQSWKDLITFNSIAITM